MARHSRLIMTWLGPAGEIRVYLVPDRQNLWIVYVAYFVPSKLQCLQGFPPFPLQVSS
jgi:hypothetical protein